MKKLEISLSDEEWERLKLAVTVNLKKIPTDVAVTDMAQSLMVAELKRFTCVYLRKLEDTGTPKEHITQ